MYLNMHLLRSLLNRSTLFGMVLGAYWAIVLVGNFPAHAGNELGDMEMMKRDGGGSSGAWCRIYTEKSSCCTPQYCPGCTLGQAYEVCTVDPLLGQTAYEQAPSCPQECSTISGNQYCNTGNFQSVDCFAAYICNCEPEGEEAYCIPAAEVSYWDCEGINVGTDVPCPHSLCVH